MSKEPALITAKGSLNVGSWTKWYMATYNVSYLRAHKVFNENVQGMPEPAMADANGKPNPVWVTWYRLKKKVSSNVSKMVCANRLKDITEGKPIVETKGWW